MLRAIAVIEFPSPRKTPAVAPSDAPESRAINGTCPLLLMVLATGALALTLLTSVLRHRRDLAILKALGFLRRQVSATVSWQAAAIILPAIVIGIPAGVVLGRWTWRLVADNVGSVSPSVVPIEAVLLVVPAALVLAGLLAVAPAWTAWRVHPGETLHSE